MDEQCHAGKPFNIHPFFQQLTCDVIARVALGEQHDLQRDPNNRYIELCRQLFPANPSLIKNIWNIFASTPVSFRLMRYYNCIISVVLPELSFLARAGQDITHKLTGSNAWFELSEKILKIVEKRRLEKVVDLLWQKIETLNRNLLFRTAKKDKSISFNYSWRRNPKTLKVRRTSTRSSKCLI